MIQIREEKHDRETFSQDSRAAEADYKCPNGDFSHLFDSTYGHVPMLVNVEEEEEEEEEEGTSSDEDGEADESDEHLANLIL